MKLLEITVNPTGPVVVLEGDQLTPDELGPVMAELLHNTLGDEPSMGDILQIQKAMMGALS